MMVCTGVCDSDIAATLDRLAHSRQRSRRGDLREWRIEWVRVVGGFVWGGESLTSNDGARMSAHTLKRLSLALTFSHLFGLVRSAHQRRHRHIPPCLVRRIGGAGESKHDCLGMRRGEALMSPVMACRSMGGHTARANGTGTACTRRSSATRTKASGPMCAHTAATHRDRERQAQTNPDPWPHLSRRCRAHAPTPHAPQASLRTYASSGPDELHDLEPFESISAFVRSGEFTAGKYHGCGRYHRGGVQGFFSSKVLGASRDGLWTPCNKTLECPLELIQCRFAPLRISRDCPLRGVRRRSLGCHCGTAAVSCSLTSHEARAGGVVLWSS